MESNLTKIIVKVGNKTSNVRFSHCNVFRALVTEDLYRLTNKYKDCKIVVIENIDNDEYDRVKQFVIEFSAKNEDNSVLFFIADENDEITSGLADELEYNIYLTLKDVYNVIKSKYNLNVSVFLSDKKQDLVGDSDLPGVFDVLDSSSNSDIDEAVKDINSQDETSNIFESLAEDRATAMDKTYTEKSLDDDTEEESPKIEVKLEKKGEINKKAEINKKDLSEEIETVDKKEIYTSNLDSDTTDLIEQQQTEIERLKMKLRDAKYDYNEILKDIKGANTRVSELESLVVTLKDQKKAVQDRYEELLSDDYVMEDPIPLAEYEDLKKEIEDKEASIKRLENSLNEIKAISEEDRGIIDAKDVEISELTRSLNELKESIASGDIHKEVKEEYEKQLEEQRKSNTTLQRNNSELNEKVMRLTESVTDNDEVISDLKKKLAFEDSYREEYLGLVTSAFIKLRDTNKELVNKSEQINELDSKLKTNTSANKSLQAQNSNLNNRLNDLQTEINNKNNEIQRLNKQIQEFNTRMQLSNEYSDSEMSKLKMSVAELEAKLNLANDQLKHKEEQYNILMSQSNVKEASSNAMVEANKGLEQMNRSLMEQLSTISKELTTQKMEKESAQAKANEYSNEVARLRNEMTTLAASLGGGTGGANVVLSSSISETIRPISYMGPARLISVMGSGSFGITTMAMTLLYKLASTARVLYLDFDLVSPNADAWFSKPPICRDIPGINPKDARMTCLGILYEKGASIVSAYIDKMIIPIERTKGGCIDYFSGAYYSVDRSKLFNADYNTLFNLIGSKYEYIIIDCGRLGSSDVNDQIIKAISDISYRTVVVTTSDRFEIRNFMMKVNNNKFEHSKIAWMVNMCSGSGIDPNAAKSINNFDNGMLFEDQALRSTRDKFTRDRMNRDRIDMFITSALFKR